MMRFHTGMQWAIVIAGVLLSPFLLLVVVFAAGESVAGAVSAGGVGGILTLAAVIAVVTLIRRLRAAPEDAAET